MNDASFIRNKFGLFPIYTSDDNNGASIDSIVSVVERDDAWRDFVGSDVASQWDALAAEYSKTKFGDVCYMTGFELIRSSNGYTIFRALVSPAQYPEHLATLDILRNNPEVLKKYLKLAHAADFETLLKNSMPSTMKVNVAMVNEWDYFLAVKRSQKVGAKRGLWTCGPNETMETVKNKNNKLIVENFTSVAERCMAEETGMVPGDYNEMRISWVGYDVRTAQIKIYVQTSTKLGPKTIASKINSSSSHWETEEIKWLALNNESKEEIDASFSSETGKNWSSSAPLSVRQLIKYNDEPFIQLS